MDMDGIGSFALFLSSGAVGLGLILLAGFRMKLKNGLELERLRGDSGESVDQLREEMHDIIDHQNTQIAELQERIDFAERLLAKGDD